MGQYYKALVQRGTTLTQYDTTVNVIDENGNKSTEWQGCKLTEHSWIGNTFVDSIAKKIYNRKARIAWVGDYTSQARNVLQSSDGTICPVAVEDLYDFSHYNKETKKSIPVTVEGYKTSMGKTITYDIRTPFTYKDKYFINLSRKEYIDMNEYIERSEMKDDWIGWCQNPVSLMTATSNGLSSGGDYYINAIDSAMVGRWAYDEVVIKDVEPKGFEKLNVTFNEHIQVPVAGLA